jgi:outer membrane protein insertion porin family
MTRRAGRRRRMRLEPKKAAWTVALAWALGSSVLAAKPAEIEVGGFGLLKNREMRQALDMLLGDGVKRDAVDASFIEDAALVLNSELVEDGFFEAKVVVAWTDVSGRTGNGEVDAHLSRPLPRPLAATRVRLEARPGRRAVVEAVRFEGLSALKAEEGESFFRPRVGLFTPDKARAWSTTRAKRAAEQLREALRARGRAEARVEIADTDVDRETGAVALHVRVDEGPLWRARDWRAEVAGGDLLLGAEPKDLIGRPWSRALVQDQAQAMRSLYYERGYADARISWAAEPEAEVRDGERAVTAVAKVEPGEAWKIGAVRTEGAFRTRPGLIETRVRLKPGAPFDPQAIDAARLRLARLGIFERVDGRDADGVGPGVRDVVFHVTEEASWEAAWTLGYGSYEQLRAGVELSRGNLWGLAHRDRVELGQSMKASRGEYRYTVPTLFDDTVEGSARLFGLRREEPSFTRLEYGGGLEAARDVPWIEARGTAGLNYEVLRAEDVELGVSGSGATETAVTALTLGLTRDRRDNPIRPRSGQRWAVRTETALPELGSEVRYERVELAWSWHRPLGGDDRWVHVGASHGLLADGGDEVPVNKLFFPGGESSIRGYMEGEAAPRDANGRFLGARSVWLVNLEFEQVVTGRWTALMFLDVSGASAREDDWPGREVLGSAGPGVRYQSPIGPIRLEYGWNLMRREDDPVGTLHFSIGFPF